jgi:hypothetical protein
MTLADSMTTTTGVVIATDKNRRPVSFHEQLCSRMSVAY